MTALPAPNPSGRVPERPIRVLVVNDHEDRALACRALAHEPFELDCVADLQAARDHLAARVHQCLMLDLELPDAQLLAVLRSLRDCSPPPIVVLAEDRVGDLAIEAIRAGADDYIGKEHAAPAVLERIIRYAIERRQATERVREAEDLAQTHSRAQTSACRCSTSRAATSRSLRASGACSAAGPRT